MVAAGMAAGIAKEVVWALPVREVTAVLEGIAA